jgi:hypothetical protein
MSAIDKCRLALTQCSKCYGCNRLSDDTFRGDDGCKNFRDGISEPEKKREFKNLSPSKNP